MAMKNTNKFKIILTTNKEENAAITLCIRDVKSSDMKDD